MCQVRKEAARVADLLYKLPYYVKKRDEHMHFYYLLSMDCQLGECGRYPIHKSISSAVWQ